MLLTSLCFGFIMCRMSLIEAIPHRTDMTELAHSTVTTIIIILIPLQDASNHNLLETANATVETLVTTFHISEKYLPYLFPTPYFMPC